MRITIKSLAITAIAALFALTSCNNDLKADIEALQAEQELQNSQGGDNQVASLETQIEAMNAAIDMFTKEIAPKLSAIGTWLKETESELTNANKDLAKAIETKTAAADFLSAVNAFKTVADKAVEAGQKLEGPEDFALETLCTQLAAYKDAIEETIKATDKSVAEKNTQAMVYATAAKAAGDAAIEMINKHASDNAEATAALTDKMVPALQARVKASLDAIVSIHEALSGKPTAEAIKAAYALFEETTNANVLAMEDVLLGTIKGRLDTAAFTNFKNAYLNRFDGYEAWKIYVDATLVKHASEIAKLRADLEDEVAALQKQIDNLETELEQQVEKINAYIDSVKDNLQGQIDKLKAELEQQVEKINAYIGSVKDNLQQQIDTIDKTIEAIQKDLEGVHVEMDKMGKSIEAIQKDLLGVHGEINTINGEINTINGKIVAINTEIEKLWKAVNLLNADKDTEGSVKYYVEQLRINLQAQIDVLEGRVTINEEDIKALKAEIRALKARVQSLVFVPQYTDMMFGIPFSVIKADDTHAQYEAFNKPEDGFEIVYKVAPADLAEPLANAVNAVAASPTAGPVFTFVIESGLQTRAYGPELTILKATGDNTTGKISFRLHHNNFIGADVKDGKYAISLRIDDESADATVPEVKKGIHVASEYVQTTVQPSSQIDIVMDHVYKAKADGTGVEDGIALKNVNSATDTQFEVGLSLPYTMKETVAPYKDYELAATITTGGLKTGPFTYAQLREKGYNMPVVGVTVEEKTSVCSYFTREGTGAASTIKVNNTSMKDVKTHHNDSATPAWGESHTLGLNYAFDTGLGIDLNMQALIAIVKTDLELGFNFPYEFNWTYQADKDVDHANRPAGSYTHNTNYTRAWDGTPSFTVKPVLASVNGVALATPLELDGSNDVYGLEPSDFNGKAFTKVSTPSNFDIDLDITDTHYDNTNKTLSPDGVTVKTQLGGTYSGTGKYILDLAKTAVNVNYTITTKDRKTNEIIITAPATDHVPAGVTATTTTASLNRFGVVLLGGTDATDGGSYNPHYDYDQGTSGSYVLGWCHQNCNVYGVASGDIAPAMYDAFKSQGIFTASDYASATAALANNEEFDKNFIYVNNSNNMSTFGGKYYNFVLNENGTGITLRSNTGANYYGNTHAEDSSLPTKDYVYDYGFKSSSLKAIAQAYPDAHEGVDYSADTYAQRFLRYSFFTYVGQKVTLYWSFTAEAPKNTNYALKTNVNLSYDSTSKLWYYNMAPNYQYSSTATSEGDKSYINHVFTYMNMQEQVGVYDGAAKVTNENKYYRDDRHIYPEFKLVDSYTGIVMTSLPGESPYVNSDHIRNYKNDVTDLNANILNYYGHADKVQVKGHLYVDSDNVSFPLTHKIVSGTDKLDVIQVNKYNPFREDAYQPLTIACDAQAHGTTFTMPLTFKDKMGFDVIYQGNLQNPFNHNEILTTLASLGAVYSLSGDSVSLVEVDGAAPTGGWALNVTTVDPPMIKVTVPSGATHETHTLKIKVATKWQDYIYTATVPVY